MNITSQNLIPGYYLSPMFDWTFTNYNTIINLEINTKMYVMYIIVTLHCVLSNTGAIIIMKLAITYQYLQVL
jgi:hypothetical protein